ncbi:hypothetical protein AYR47_18950 [Pseudomonas azotoformans]|uniref:Uncharacterized protein n=1 Tax=Pseudomonas azotoformans TaxID=47878 RepID=A0A127I146_PSEAZ|nr:hypothetical protein AYR47_18950 [Pseudomonas azotoformans]
MFTALFTQSVQMHVIQLFSQRDVFLIPSMPSCLVTTDQQHRASSWIKGIQHSKWPPCMLYAQFPQVAMPGSLDIAAVGKAQSGP